ncbi:hypothetical protein IAD21_00574 [Abditibacteriota bacterium]|nr:hypothetical protein IAD21_00574 [Abditibacteriota bacterium]
MDIAALLALLLRRREFPLLAATLIASWGPPGRRLIGADFMPPRVGMDNAGTIDNLRYFTIAAPSTTRYSSAPLEDGGEMFASLNYSLGDGKIARQFTGSDYDGLVGYLARNETMEAIAAVIGWSNTALLQSLVERSEFQIWKVLTSGGYGKFGDNGFVEIVNGPDLSGQFIEAAEDWSDPEVNPYPVIEARIQRLVSQGFVKSGIRIVFTDQVRTILKNNPFTAVKSGKSLLVTNSDGTVQTQPISGIVDDSDIDKIFRAMGVQAPITYDERGWTTAKVQKRFFPEGNMAFIASTGRNENVRFNHDNPADVRAVLVPNIVGVVGIGRANGQSVAGRRVAVRPYTDEAAARLEGEAWTTEDPLLLEPLAVCGLFGIQ